MEDKKNQPDFECAAFRRMNNDWKRTQDLWGGIRAVRESSENYLTQFAYESINDHTGRKKATEFYNVFGSTIGTVVGLICNKNIAPSEAPTPISDLFSDIDLCGNDLASFLRQTETNAVRDGHAFIFVDAPPPIEIEGPTLADVQDRRPFWVNYQASQARNWQIVVENGKSIINQITFREVTNEADGLYGEKEVVRYRVLKRGSYSLYREEKEGQRVDRLVAEFEDRPTSTTEIPIVAVYTKRISFLESQPPYLDLLETNVTHYNSQSILREALKYVVPMPIFKLNSDGDVENFKKIIVAANRGIMMWGEHADAKYLELEGKSVEELRVDIENLEKRMAKLGVEKFAPIVDGTTKTAFEIGSDNRKEMSEVAVFAKNLEDAVEMAFYFTGELLNAIKGRNTVDLDTVDKTALKLNIEYDKLTFSLEQMQFFLNLLNDGHLSHQTFWEMLQTMIDMPQGWKPALETKRLMSDEPVISATQMPNEQDDESTPVN